MKLTYVLLPLLLCLLPAAGMADSGHLHSAIPLLEKLVETPVNKTVLGELRFLAEAIENSPDNRQVKAALLAVVACGRLQAGQTEGGLAVCRKIKTDYGVSDFAGLVDPARLETPGQPGKVSMQQVERCYRQVLENALAVVVNAVRQSKVAKVQASARIGKSEFRKPGEKAPEPKPFVAASLAEQIKRPEDYPMPDRSKANLFDGLVYLCRRKNLDLSVDPEVLSMLAGLNADLPTLAAVEDFAALETLLSSHSLLLAKAEVAPNRSTAFVTAPSLWSYSSACRLLQDNDLQGAFRMLEEGATDTTRFAEHAAKFKDILLTTARTRRSLNTLDRNLRGALEAYERAKTAAGVSRPAGGLERGDGSSATGAGAAARQSLQRATRQVEEIKIEFENAVRSIGEANLSVVERFNEAVEARLYAEASYILEYLVDTRRLADEMAQAFTDADKKFKVAIPWSTKVDVPEDIQAARAMLKDAVKSAAARVDAARPIVNSNPAKAAEQFSAAFHQDRVNLAARVGMGHCAVRRHTAVLADVFENNWADDGLAARLAGENRNRRRDGFLRAMNFVTYGSIPLPVEGEGEDKQAAAGISLAAAPGAVLTLTVRLDQRRRSAGRRQPARTDPYWKNLRLARVDESDLLAQGISFSNQEKTDPRLSAAALDVLKWLKWSHEKAMRNKGMHIEFALPDGPAPDDSLGLAAALGGYSCISNAPLRPDVASTGALQPDGALRSAGAAYDGLSAAARADRIELLLAPRSAEPELLFVPLDYLCLVVIISADQIGVLKNYAFDPTYRGEAIDRLREAQALTLLGQHESALPILQDIAARYPEIYTARRLLELMALYRRD